MTGRLRRLRRTLPIFAACCLQSFAEKNTSLLPLVAQGQDQIQSIEGGGLQTPSSNQFRATAHTIRGTVVNSVTGEPISRALVQIGGQFATLTDHEGHFEFSGVTQSGIPPWAMKPGYFPDREGHVIAAPPDATAVQTEDESVVVKLVPEVVISGAVTGQSGEPLSGIPVHLKVLAVSDGVGRWSERQGTITNSEGQYRFFDLEAGKYAVVTGFHAEGLPDAPSSVAYVPARYPEKSERPDASAIAMTAGDRREFNLSPPIEKLYPIVGGVAGYTEGKPVTVRAETPDGEEISAAFRFNEKTGEFRMMLPSGSFVLTATCYQQPEELEGKLALTIPQAHDKAISIGVEPAATIPVDIDRETVNQPGADNGQTPTGAWGGMDVHLTRADGSGSMLFLSALPNREVAFDNAQANPGPLRIENVSPGRYFLQTTPQDPWYVASATCGGVDLMREELVIAGSAAGCSIRIVVRNDSGSVHVTVHDPNSPSGQSTTRTFVTLLPVDSTIQRAILRPVQAGLDIKMDGVGPGRYLVLAQDRPRELAYRDPEAMRRYAGVGQLVTVAANGTADAEVSVVHGEP